MCVVSMVTDHYSDRFRDNFPQLTSWTGLNLSEVSRAEFNALKREIEDLKKLLTKAKEYDDRTGQPDCEKDEKVAIVRKVAEAVGVDLSDVLGPSA